MIDDLLSRLEYVKQTGADRWKARCPAHEDRDPSLSIRECRDGTVLIHCFTGCGAADILAAVGLEMGALFPEGPAEHLKNPRTRHTSIDHERAVLMICDADRKAGKVLSEQDKQRERLAFERVNRRTP